MEWLRAACPDKNRQGCSISELEFGLGSRSSPICAALGSVVSVPSDDLQSVENGFTLYLLLSRNNLNCSVPDSLDFTFFNVY